MGTRTSFRPRPLDVGRPLPIVRDLAELDNTDGLLREASEAGDQVRHLAKHEDCYGRREEHAAEKYHLHVVHCKLLTKPVLLIVCMHIGKPSCLEDASLALGCMG
jgi:hypothetical protein